jgi:hypothetical protein
LAKRGNLVRGVFSLLQHTLPIDAQNHPALIGDAQQTEKKSAK